MLKFLYLICIVILILFAGCAIPPPPVSPPLEEEMPLVDRILPEGESPAIKIGLLWGVRHVDLTLEKDCYFLSHDGTFAARGNYARKWQAEVRQHHPGKVVYRLVAASMSSAEKARQKAREIKKRGFETEIKPVVKRINQPGVKAAGTTLYRLYLTSVFDTRDIAALYRDEIADKIETFITTEMMRKPSGIIRLSNPATSQYFESSKAILIHGSSVTVHDIPVGRGYHWEKHETRSYPADIRLEIGHDGLLAVINQLPVETYLKGVVPSEMPAGFPSEALKAQAVAARSETMAKLGLVHTTDPFDLCADVHCQVYSGLSKRTVMTDRAVEETGGIVLFYDDDICDAVYSSVCGGHTENNQDSWGGAARPYLQGVRDGSSQLNRYGDLSVEKNVRRWIDSNPAAYCQSNRDEVPSSLDYTKKYFRWQVTYSQYELQRIVREKTGKSLGAIYQLMPVERGVSGRITKLRIIGETDSIFIERELNIRKALSDNTLWSACFYVERMGSQNGAPQMFRLHGAGFGHGVGMCQTGAAVMALEKKSFQEILKHYYRGVTLKKLY